MDWKRWLKVWKKFIVNSFAGFGFLSAIYSVFDVLFPNKMNLGWQGLFLLAISSAIWGLFRSRPKNTFCYTLHGRDVNIEIAVKDIFELPGSIVVPMNNEFDTSLVGNVMKSNSVQKSLTEKYFDSNPDYFKDKINEKLLDKFYNLRKIKGSKNKYSLGTVVELQQYNKRIYLVVNSIKNDNSRAVLKQDNLPIFLSELWNHLSSNCSKDCLNIPVFGTGNGRLNMKREDVIKEIILSFIASCSDRCYCEKITIAIHPSDVDKYGIDLDMLDDFLRSKCLYANFSTRNIVQQGTAA